MSNTQEKRQFTSEEWSYLTNYFVGNNYRFRENIVIPKNLGPIKIKSNEEKMIESFFESCTFKTIMSCVAGKNNLKFHFHIGSLNCLYFRLWLGSCNWFIFV